MPDFRIVSFAENYNITGSPIPDGAKTAQAHGDPAVYFVEGFVKHHVANPEAMDRYHLSTRFIASAC
jgi:hypothetical protein